MSEHTRVIRIRLPRDRSFLYFRIERTGRRVVKVHAELIARRYYSPKRVEVMTFDTTAPPTEDRA